MDPHSAYSEQFITDSNASLNIPTKSQKFMIENNNIKEKNNNITRKDDIKIFEAETLSIGSYKGDDTTSDQSDIESKIKDLINDLKEKEKEIIRLKTDLSSKNKRLLKDKKSELKERVESYNILIDSLKSELSKDPIKFLEAENFITPIGTKEKVSELISAISSKYSTIERVEREENGLLNSSNTNIGSLNQKNLDEINDKNQKYEDDFVAEDNKSTIKSELKKDNPPKNTTLLETNFEKDEIKSITSEISENINVNNDETEVSSTKKSDDDETISDESDSSTATQILLLGSREKKHSVESILSENIDQIIFEADAKLSNIIQKEPTTVDTKYYFNNDNLVLKENAVNSVENTLVINEINHVISIRGKKMKSLQAYVAEASIKKMENSETSERVQETLDIFDPNLTNYKLSEKKIEKPNIPAINLNSVQRQENMVVPKTWFDNLTMDNIYNVFDELMKEWPSLVLEHNKIGELTAYDEITFDLVKEFIYDLYRENFEEKKSLSNFLPEFKRVIRKNFFKNITSAPTDTSRSKKLIIEKINGLIKPIEANAENYPFKLEKNRDYNADKKSKWRIQKRLDLVDTILDKEMREDEHEWSNYEQEEIEAKLLMSDIIFESLLNDTLSLFSINVKHFKKFSFKN